MASSSGKITIRVEDISLRLESADRSDVAHTVETKKNRLWAKGKLRKRIINNHETNKGKHQKGNLAFPPVGDLLVLKPGLGKRRGGGVSMSERGRKGVLREGKSSWRDQKLASRLPVRGRGNTTEYESVR